MVGDLSPGDRIHADRSRPMIGGREASLGQPRVHPEDVDDLPASIRAQRADPHSGKHLPQPLLERVHGVASCLVRLKLLGAPLAGLLGRQLQQQPRMDCRCADRHQHCDVVDVERVAGFHGQVGARAPPHGNELLVDAAGGEDGRDRDAALTGRPIGNHDEIHAPSCRGTRLTGEPRQPEREPARAARDRPGRIQDRDSVRGAEQLAPTVVVEDRRVDDDSGRLGRAKKVRLPPDRHGERHHGALALRVDRRVGHLGERLAQEGRDPARPPRERRDRRVVAHAPDRLVALGRHRSNQLLDDLGVEAHGNAEPIIAGRRLPDRDAGDQAARNSPRRRAVALDGRPDHPARRDVDHHHLAGAKPAPMRHPLRGELNAPRFGRDDHQPVVGRRQRQWPKPVAVEHRSDASTVGEHERGRAVPRLRAGMGRVQCRASEPFSRRDQRADGGIDSHPAQQQQLERVVQRLRVGADLGHQRADLGKPRGPSASAQRMASSAHRFAVRSDRVDLAVVRQVPERLCQPPRGEGVRRVALMEHGVARVEVIGPEILVEAPELIADEQSLVDHLG